MKKAIETANVDIREGIVFVKQGQFYGEEVYSKYPELFEDKETVKEIEEIKVTEPVQVIEVPEITGEVKIEAAEAETVEGTEEY